MLQYFNPGQIKCKNLSKKPSNDLSSYVFFCGIRTGRRRLVQRNAAVILGTKSGHGAKPTRSLHLVSQMLLWMLHLSF